MDIYENGECTDDILPTKSASHDNVTPISTVPAARGRAPSPEKLKKGKRGQHHDKEEKKKQQEMAKLIAKQRKQFNVSWETGTLLFGVESVSFTSTMIFIGAF